MSTVKRIPVFVFPSGINFYLEDQTSHKQTMTIYNPYDFPLKFRVLSTAPNKYYVSDPEGSLGPGTYVDILVRHTQPTQVNCNVTDKFRVTVLDHVTKQIIGKRDLPAILHEHEREGSFGDADNFHAFSVETDSTIASRTRAIRSVPSQRSLSMMENQRYFILVATIISCLIVLYLPTAEEIPQHTSIPEFLHLGLHIKMAMAFALGLSSIIILEWFDSYRLSL